MCVYLCLWALCRVTCWYSHTHHKPAHTHACANTHIPASDIHPHTPTGWRRCIGCLRLQVSFRKRATNVGVLLRKMTGRATARRTAPTLPRAIRAGPNVCGKEFRVSTVGYSQRIAIHPQYLSTHTRTHYGCDQIVDKLPECFPALKWTYPDGARQRRRGAPRLRAPKIKHPMTLRHPVRPHTHTSK